MSPQPRAVGVRREYSDIPDRVRAWVESTLGDRVTEADGQPGGMSPGCAARLRTANGSAAFVKAVGAELNPLTPGLFRREIEVFEHVPDVAYRPRVIATYDDGGWVALLLGDIHGRYPDLNDQDEADAVWATVEHQSRELSPAPSGLEIRTLPGILRRFLERWRQLMDAPDSGLPSWVAHRADELDHRMSTLPQRVPITSLCHWDVRDDNVLIRPDGTVVILDWGMACLGPWWADLFVLALAWVDTAEFDARVRAISPPPADDDVTDLLLLFGLSQAWHARQPAPPGLDTMPDFTRRQAARMLAGAGRRLNVSPP